MERIVIDGRSGARFRSKRGSVCHGLRHEAGKQARQGRQAASVGRTDGWLGSGDRRGGGRNPRMGDGMEIRQ